MSDGWKITTSERFRRYQRRANADVARLVDAEVLHLADRAKQRPALLAHDYTLRKGTVVDVPILEIEVGGSIRILAANFEGRNLCLLMGGPHDNVYAEWDRSQKQILQSAQRSQEPYRSTTRPDLSLKGLGKRAADLGIVRRWDEELDDRWVYFLDEEQSRVADAVVDAVVDAVLRGEGRRLLIVGGPGTGKTAVLLKAMGQLSGRDGISIRLDCTDRLAEYLTEKTRLPIAEWRTQTDPDVVVVDDPPDLWTARDGRPGDPPIRIVAMDLLQLDEIPDDATFGAFLQEPGVTAFPLRECYRQKQEPGRHALEVSERVAMSSPYLADYKIERHRKAHENVHRLSLDMDFTNPTGVFVAEEQCTPEILRDHLRWLQAQVPRRTGWPAIAIVRDAGPQTPWVDDAVGRLHADLVPRSQIEERIKGLDYDHVVLLLAPATYRAAFGVFEGTGERRYREYRKLRIPFTRARDSIGVFGIPHW